MRKFFTQNNVVTHYTTKYQCHSEGASATEESHNLNYSSAKDYDVASYKSMFHLFTAPRIKCNSEPADWSCRPPITSAGCSALCSACSPRNDNEVCSLAPCGRGYKSPASISQNKNFKKFYFYVIIFTACNSYEV